MYGAGFLSEQNHKHVMKKRKTKLHDYKPFAHRQIKNFISK